MRIRKHRAWHRESKVMLYESSAQIFKWLGEGQPIDIMDITGLTDKKGKEIYEGDIVKWGKRTELEERIAEVKIDPLGNCLDCTNISVPHVFYMAKFAYGAKDLEIIGNIYENPELLSN